MQCCSGTACAAAERQFGPQIAQRDIQRYRRKGPDATTRALLAGVREVMPAGGSLLDIGGGVGVVMFELLADGRGEATLVDGSSSYVEGAGREAERRGHATRIRLVTCDFTAVADRIEPADIVAMHRVVCCFAGYDALIARQIADALDGRTRGSVPDTWVRVQQAGAAGERETRLKKIPSEERRLQEVRGLANVARVYAALAARFSALAERSRSFRTFASCRDSERISRAIRCTTTAAALRSALLPADTPRTRRIWRWISRALLSRNSACDSTSSTATSKTPVN
jgi:methyltransferase family protein